tara:strand:- start:10721 stop:14749 length:4029 start_codon:yes stop_codon:yes gene_type:complete
MATDAQQKKLNRLNNYIKKAQKNKRRSRGARKTQWSKNLIKAQNQLKELRGTIQKESGTVVKNPGGTGPVYRDSKGNVKKPPRSGAVKTKPIPRSKPKPRRTVEDHMVRISPIERGTGRGFTDEELERMKEAEERGRAKYQRRQKTPQELQQLQQEAARVANSQEYKNLEQRLADSKGQDKEALKQMERLVQPLNEASKAYQDRQTTQELRERTPQIQSRGGFAAPKQSDIRTATPGSYESFKGESVTPPGSKVGDMLGTIAEGIRSIPGKVLDPLGGNQNAPVEDRSSRRETTTRDTMSSLSTQEDISGPGAPIPSQTRKTKKATPPVDPNTGNIVGTDIRPDGSKAPSRASQQGRTASERAQETRDPFLDRTTGADALTGRAAAEREAASEQAYGGMGGPAPNQGDFAGEDIVTGGGSNITKEGQERLQESFERLDLYDKPDTSAFPGSGGGAPQPDRETSGPDPIIDPTPPTTPTPEPDPPEEDIPIGTNPPEEPPEETAPVLDPRETAERLASGDIPEALKPSVATEKIIGEDGKPPEGTVIDEGDISTIDEADVPDVIAPDDVVADTVTADEATAETAVSPGGIEASTYDAQQVSDLDPTEAAVGEVSEGAIASPEEIRELSERAEGETLTDEEMEKVLAKESEFTISDDAFVPSVIGEVADVAPTADAELQQRKAILGDDYAEGTAAEITETVSWKAAQRRAIKGTAAVSAAKDMVEEVGELPPAITAAIVEDPATVEAQLDEQPVEVRAAIAALPPEALVSSQMESLLAGMDEGTPPAWARPAIAAVEQKMAMRGLSTSTVGRDALFNSIIQSAMPIAQSNAQALQARAAQNLSNQQQSFVEESRQRMNLRLANLANRQTAASQTAQMSQQMKVLQSQFDQSAVMQSAADTQQMRMQNLQNRQRAAEINAQQVQQMAIANLSNEQQMEVVNLQLEADRLKDNQSAENQKRLQEHLIAAQFITDNAKFKQDMEKANMSNEQQLHMANLLYLNQTESENLTARQATELANMEKELKTNLTAADIASTMNVAQLSADQKRAITNATMVANVDMAKFDDAQKISLANSKAMMTMTLANLDNEQQATIANATAMANLDLATVDQRTKVAVNNANAFLKMDLANLANEQQGIILDQQNKQQTLLSNQAAENAARQFNAANEQQKDIFNTNLAKDIEIFNKDQLNNMERFNTAETNKAKAITAGNKLEAEKFNADMEASISKFNTDKDLRRETFNATQENLVVQSNAEWMRNANLADTAAQNANNRQEAALSSDLTKAGLAFLWQELRDEAQFNRQAAENMTDRKINVINAALSNPEFMRLDTMKDQRETIFAMLDELGLTT